MNSQDLLDLLDYEEQQTAAEPRNSRRRGKTNKQHSDNASKRRPTATPRPRAQDAPEWFACVHCGHPVTGQAFGTEHRNHCNSCLWSRHVDETPGDRASECRAGMEPIAVWARPGGDWAIIHRCRGCGELKSNRIAGDDNELLLVALAAKALSQPPFPLSRLLAFAPSEEKNV